MFLWYNIKLELKWLRVPHNNNKNNNKIDKYKSFYNAATLSRTLRLLPRPAAAVPATAFFSWSVSGGIEKPPESMQQQVFYAISVQFLNLYPVANLSTHSGREEERGRRNGGRVDSRASLGKAKGS